VISSSNLVHRFFDFAPVKNQENQESIESRGYRVIPYVAKIYSDLHCINASLLSRQKVVHIPSVATIFWGSCDDSHKINNTRTKRVQNEKTTPIFSMTLHSTSNTHASSDECLVDKVSLTTMTKGGQYASASSSQQKSYRQLFPDIAQAIQSPLITD